jgi:hypothetical protein
MGGNHQNPLLDVKQAFIWRLKPGPIIKEEKKEKIYPKRFMEKR